jgi:hypothetical protein
MTARMALLSWAKSQMTGYPFFFQCIAFEWKSQVVFPIWHICHGPGVNMHQCSVRQHRSVLILPWNFSYAWILLRLVLLQASEEFCLWWPSQRISHQVCSLSACPRRHWSRVFDAKHLLVVRKRQGPCTLHIKCYSVGCLIFRATLFFDGKYQWI